MRSPAEQNEIARPAAMAGDQAAQVVPRLEIRGLVKQFTRLNGTTMRAVDDITLDVHPGEMLILLGPSGCGKTTLLRLIAGLEEPAKGKITISGTTIYSDDSKSQVPPEGRPISMVFQSYGLWPHMTIFDNIAYPLRNRKVGKQDIGPRVDEVMKIVGIDGLQKQYPAQLSGGQQQRVALARAVVSANDVVLFDEPLSNVDAKVRDQLRIEIMRLQRQLGFTGVYVTHDQEEAMTLGTRIAVLQEGRIAQLAAPRQVYENPASPYVARFVGTVDEFRGTVRNRSEDTVEVSTEGGTSWTVRTTKALPTDVILMTRPERWSVSMEPRAGVNNLRGEIRASIFLAGSRTEFIVRTAEGTVRVWAAHGEQADEGDTVYLHHKAQDVLVFGADE